MAEFDEREDVRHYRRMLRLSREMADYYERKVRDHAEQIARIKREDYEKTKAEDYDKTRRAAQ